MRWLYCLLFLAGSTSGYGPLTYAQSVPSSVPASGLLAWYSFDSSIVNGTGDASLDGLQFGGEYVADRYGTPGAAAGLSGNHLLQLPLNAAILTNEFTLSFWALKRANLGHNVIQIATPNGPSRANFGFTSPSNSGAPYVSELNCSGTYGDCGYTALGTPTSMNEWFHLVFVVHGFNSSIYLNGVELNIEKTCALYLDCESDQMSLWFGGDVGGGDVEYFDVDFDDVGIWNRPLTPVEVNMLYTGSISGCTSPAACNFNAQASIDDGSCVFPNQPCEICNSEGGIASADEDGDGVCDADEVFGCTDINACNHDWGATEDDGTCTYPAVGYDCCGGCCLHDMDGDGVCDEFEVVGCQVESACNFNPAATDPGECFELEYWVDECGGTCISCNGIIINDSDGDMVCGVTEPGGCTDATACNFDAFSCEDGICIYPSGCFECDGNGGVTFTDTDEDGIPDCAEILGCMDPVACNFNPVSTIGGPCLYYTYVESGCGGICVFCGDELFADSNDDGICDANSVCGCMNPWACNYNVSATIDDGSCTYPVDYCFDCSGDYITPSYSICLGIEYFPIEGCWDANACNYSSCMILDSYMHCGVIFPNCIYPPGDLTCEQWHELDSDGDGIADPDEILGCTYEAACNFNDDATDDDGTCIFINSECEYCYQAYWSNWGVACLVDVDENGVCDCNEAAGCMDANACNFEAQVVWDDGSCIYPENFYDCFGVCLQDDDEDGICEELEIIGCMDSSAINYLGTATDAGPCFYPSDFFDAVCEEDLQMMENLLSSGAFCGEGTIWSPMYQMCLPIPVCLGDISGDGVVGTNDLLALLSVYGENCALTGCSLPFAMNFDPDAEEDDLSCAIAGCADPLALNYLPGVNVAQNDICQYAETSISGACLGLDQITFHQYTYALVEIGSHCWFKENLRTTQFADSTVIPFYQQGDGWGGTTGPAASYPEGSSLLANTFGLLYNWYTVIDERLLCPEGWHPADSAAWNEAISIAGGAVMGGLNMKIPGSQAMGNGVWEFDNALATNSTGFSAIPAGYRLPNGNYGGLYATGQFWGGEPLTATNARAYYLNQSLTSVGITQNNKQVGLSVRCVKQPIAGCTNPTACNYNADAELDAGTCAFSVLELIGCDCFESCAGEVIGPADGCAILEILGCTVSEACNYNPYACDEDGSCIFADPGMDCNGSCCCPGDACYNPYFDGVCDCTEIMGCVDSFADNFNPYATVDDGSCLYFGCTDPDAMNYDGNATVDDGSCYYCACWPNCGCFILGCTDAAAINYDSSATIDDGSCQY